MASRKRSSPRLVSHDVYKGGIGEEEFSEVSLTRGAQGWHQGGGVQSHTMCTRVASGRRRSSLRLVSHNVHKGGIGEEEEFSEVSLTQCAHGWHRGEEEEFSEVSLAQRAQGWHRGGGGVLRG